MRQKPSNQGRSMNIIKIVLTKLTFDIESSAIYFIFICFRSLLTIDKKRMLSPTMQTDYPFIFKDGYGFLIELWLFEPELPKAVRAYPVIFTIC